jgi:hypothetical protein
MSNKPTILTKIIYRTIIVLIGILIVYYFISLNRQWLGLDDLCGDLKAAIELQSFKPLETECNAIIAKTHIVNNGMIVQSAADNLWYYSDEIPANTKKYYLLGKILPYNVKSKKIDRIYFSLPKATQTKNPEEITTIMLIDRHKSSCGKYSSGMIAYQQHIDIVFINRAIQEIINYQFFEGSRPPQILPGTRKIGANYGSNPEKDAIKYIQENINTKF